MCEYRTCTEPGCERRAVTIDEFCGEHMRTRRYDEWRDLSVLDRFWCRVDMRGPDECWPWFGSKVPSGHGMVAIPNPAGGRKIDFGAHVLAYMLAHGPIPDGYQIDHTCHNGSGCQLGNSCPHRLCMNRAHLEAVSHHENVLRGEGLAAQSARRTECGNGHDMTDPANVKMKKGRGGKMNRHCRACISMWRRDRYVRLGK